ncbi:VOC family protein [Cnuibacter sp. UC19_7]|uniref:VOC family protein n=1 Tax=Cnuibacter sp. UC19_7 TaxID=3350166 RepID=UPI00366F7089
MEFYHSVTGGDLTMSRYSEFGVSDDPTEADKIMHAQLIMPSGLILMAADVPNRMEYSRGVNALSVSLFGDDEEELTRLYEGLSEGGTIGEPLAKAPWGDSFGSFTDRFGVDWLVNISPAPQA